MQNRRSLVSGLLILYLLCTVASARAQTAPRSADWTTFRSETGSFTIDVPAKPTADIQTMNEISQNLTVAYYTSMGDGLLVIVGDLYNLPRPPAQFSEGERRSIYTNFRDGLMEGMAATLTGKGLKLDTSYGEQRNISLQGLEGFEQPMKVGNYAGRARMLVGNDRVFIFCAVAFNDRAWGLIDFSLNSFVPADRRRSVPAALRDVAVLFETPLSGHRSALVPAGKL